MQNVIDILNENPKLKQKIEILIKRFAVNNTIKEYQINNLNLNEEEQSIFDYLLAEKDIEVIYQTIDENYYTDNSLKMYLREINRFPLLSVEEEKELLNKYRSGDESAKEKLLQSNLRLVIYFANRYRNKGLDFDDLIQEGNIGLLKAIEKCDPNISRISTYASYWIKLYIDRAIGNNCKTIRLPLDMKKINYQIIKTRENFYLHNNREPSYDELSKLIGVSVERLKNIDKYFLMQPISMDCPINNEDDSYIKDIISDENSESFVKALENKDLREKLLKLINEALLTDKQKDVIIKRNFGRDKFPTLRQLAEQYQVSASYVGNIERASLQRIRKLLRKSPKFRKEFEEYIDGKSINQDQIICPTRLSHIR